MDKQNGFITHYLTSGPRLSDFISDKTDKNQIRYEQYLRSIVADRSLPAPAADEVIQIGAESELGLPWEYLYPCSGFVNFSQFSFTPQKVELLAATVLVAEEDLIAMANLWTYTAIEVWLNGEKVSSVAEPVYKPINKQKMQLPLRKGSNTMIIRMQNLAVRDTRNIFGIQLLEHLDQMTVTLPDAEQADPFLVLDRFLSGITLKGSELCFPAEAPCSIYLAYGEALNDSLIGADISGKRSVKLDEGAPMAIVYGEIGSRRLIRKIELLQNKKPTYRKGAGAAEVKSAMFEEIAAIGTEKAFQPLRFGLFYVLARWNLGQQGVNDEQHILHALGQIERREDCSDFILAGLLRFMQQQELPAHLTERTKQAILDYRFWMTENGSDGMCFWSENHALMFYICAYMAGREYPEQLFARSGRTGVQASEVALGKIREWLTDVEEYGFEEFLSADYMCVTLGALLNVVDYMEEEESARASRLVDEMLKSFAYHTFHGSIVAPQARIYRSVILPFTQSAQSLIHLLNPDTPMGNSEWIVFLMNSKYVMPQHFTSLMNESLELEYQTGNAWVKLSKQPDYMLTSVQSPRYDANPSFWQNISFDESVDTESGDYVKSFNERFHGTSRFEPGVYGYQQHMWYAALDNDTVLYTNHPGELADDGGMRPGYWYGNGIMPAVKQQGSTLGAIYEIGEDHPVAFTHLFFPEAKFDAFVQDGQWLFGKKGSGYAAIWCSERMVPHHDRLFHCEYRAYSRRNAYFCKLGSAEEFGNWEQFKAACRSLAPAFNSEALKLTAADDYELSFVRSSNKTQYV
ncbi:hypothetical protein [Paenibacillus sp. KS-LC4]|uniref:hypothetical protein n=1 Tax=Paenibacillus sp. KS-LC4 TaxID=2979727 RepID=UPI0030D04FE7